MNRKTLIVIALLVVGAVGGFLFHKDYSYRQEHGRVVAVNLLTNYEQEVENVHDKTVLVYFYKQEKNAPADEAQLDAVEKFAWDNAYDVKVVKVNVAHLENFPLMLAHGAVRTPSFVFLWHGQRVSGQAGAAADYDELKRLFGLALKQP
jgi:hypothetical protein